MNYRNELLSVYDQYMVLGIYVGDPALKQVYADAIERRSNDVEHIDAGFDLYVPSHVLCVAGQINKIDFGVKCRAQMVSTSGKMPNTGFYMYPRSSLSKTPLRLANSVGIIDSGYRGNLIGAFDATNDCSISRGDRLVQICAPGLVPIVVTLLDSLDDVTARGTGGFGSTQGTYGLTGTYGYGSTGTYGYGSTGSYGLTGTYGYGSTGSYGLTGTYGYGSTGSYGA
jgi:dUTP pyrophosphatase